MLPTSVSERLDRLAPDQREAATAPPGPVLCVAPAGSGKTTTLVARIAWLVATGTDPAAVTAVTFNKRAADEMASRVDAALEPLGLAAGAVRVKTFHALGREILADAGERVEPLLDRESVLRDLWPEIDRGTLRRLDDAFSRLKLDIGVTAAHVATDPEPGPIARAFLAYEAAIDDAGGLDFDDLVARALGCWRLDPRCCGAGASGLGICWSTRRRTSTGRSCGWRSFWRRRATRSSWLATTIRRSTAGGWRMFGACWPWPRSCRACGGST